LRLTLNLALLSAGVFKLLFLLLLSSTLVSSAQLDDESRWKLIEGAVNKNDLPRLRELLSASEDAPADIGRALLSAAKRNKIPALKLLLELRNTLSVTKDFVVESCTPLLFAAKGPHCEVVQLLLSHSAAYNRAQIDVVDQDGFTALSWAVEHGNLECVRALVNAGADVNLASPLGHTPLHSAAGHKDVELAQLLLSKGAAVNVLYIDGLSPLYKAAHSDNPAVAELLLRSGAAVDARYRGLTALHLAALKGFVDVALVLLKYGAAVDARSSSASYVTPLYYATLNKDDEMVSALLAHGASALQRPRLPIEAEFAFEVVSDEVLLGLTAVMLGLVLWALYARLRLMRHTAATRRGRGLPARAARMARSLVSRLKLVLLGAAAEVRDFFSDLWSWLASSARSFRELLRRSRRAPPISPPASPVAQLPTPARGMRRRRQPRRVTHLDVDDAASAAGVARAETRSDDGAADDAAAAVTQQTADETAALEAAQANATAAKQVKAAAEAAAAKQAAEAAAAEEAEKAAARQRAMDEAAAAEARAVAAAKAAHAAAEAAAAEDAAAAAARQRAHEAAAAAEKAATEKAASDSISTPPAVHHRPVAAAETSPPSPVLKECCVCLSDLPSAALLVVVPCGHRCLCSDCWQQLQPPAARRCPMCSSPATTAVRVFEA
jgi:ankyrin repeat protein